MAKKQIMKIAFSFLLLTFGSYWCLFADVPAPLSGDDTLVAIPLLRLSTRMSDDPFEVSYQIDVENAETGKVYPLNFEVNGSNDYQFIHGLPAGQYIIRDYGAYGLINSPKRSLSVHKTLIVDKGKLSLLPIKATSLIFTDKSDNRPLFSISFDEYDDAQKERMIAALSTNKNFGKWAH